MTKNIYIFAGKSGSGKDYIADKICEALNLKKVISYTTRPKRYEGENTHVFVSQEEFDNIRDNLAAYTLFNGYEYGTTFDTINKSDICILDVGGIKTLLKNKDRVNRPIVIIEIKAKTETRLVRMLNRGERYSDVAKRMVYDNAVFVDLDEYKKLTFANDENDDLCFDMVKNAIDFMEV